MVKALLTSRKFWLSMLGVIATLIGWITKEIPGTEAVPLLAGQLAILAGCIAYEDAGKGPKTIAAGGDVTMPQAPPTTPAPPTADTPEEGIPMVST